MVNKKLKLGLGSALAALALSGLTLEAGIRVQYYRKVQAQLDNRNVQGQNDSLGSLKQYSRNPKIIFELQPGLADVEFKDVPVSSNSMGFRGPEITQEKPADTVRIVGLGDSVMFGWGVRQEESYLAQLQDLLTEAYPQKTWEVINTGVPGYNTVMEVATMREKGLALEPDIVILNFVTNDLNLPTNLLNLRDYSGLSESFLWTELQRRRGVIPPESDLFVPLERKDMKFEDYEQDPSRVKPEYRGLVGWSAFDAALDDLKAMSQEAGFEVVTLRLWWYPLLKEMAQHAAERGFDDCLVMEFTPGTKRGWALEQGLQLAANDPHPTPKMHRMVAEKLFQHLVDSGAVARALE